MRKIEQRMVNAINNIWTWRRSGLNYDYYILDTDNNKVLDY